MKTRKTFCTVVLVATFVLSAGLLQAQSNSGKIGIKPAAGNSSVKGSGTLDHITKWVGDQEIGDTGIIETDGNVGIGLPPHPTAKLLVSTNSSDQPVAGAAIRGGNSGSGRGVEGSSVGGIGVNGVGEIGVNGLSLSTDATKSAVQGVAFNGALAGKFFGKVEVTGEVGIGATASSASKLLVSAQLDGTGATVRASNLGTGRAFEGTSVNGAGVVGRGGQIGVSGISTDGFGVTGLSQTDTGVFGNSSHADGVVGTSGGTDPTFAAIRGLAGNGALAGRFTGDVAVSGTLSKGGGSFKIDHPLDPENKYLYHSFVESPDMMNVYNGNITTDENGEAVVSLPDYFEALNKDFRYQLTVIGTFAQAIVGKKINGNRFVIKTNAPNVEVSWQVTGVRQDGWANKHRIRVEEEKPERERGFYLHPEAFNQSEERNVEWARNPEVMRQLKAAGEEFLQKTKRQ